MRAHTRTSTTFAKAISALVACALALAMLGGSVLAAPPVTHDRIVSSSAAATNDVCDGSVCTATSVFVFTNTDEPTQACLDITRYERVGPMLNVLGFESGCAIVSDGGFVIDTKSLANASLSPINIITQAFTCGAAGCQPTGETRTVQVSATYTGVGDTRSFRGNSKFEFIGCTQYFVGKGSSRDAAAALTIDSRFLAAIGQLSTSTQKIKILCH